MIEGEALNYLHHDFVRAPSILSVGQGMPPAAAGLKLSDRALQMGLILGRLERIGINVKRYAALANHFPQIEAFLKAVFVKILQKNWLGVFLPLKNLSRGFAPTLRYPRIFF